MIINGCQSLPSDYSHENIRQKMKHFQSTLTVNSIGRGGTITPDRRKIVSTKYDFCKCYQNPLGQLFKKFRNFIGPGGLSRDHYWRGGILEIGKILPITNK